MAEWTACAGYGENIAASRVEGGACDGEAAGAVDDGGYEGLTGELSERCAAEDHSCSETVERGYGAVDRKRPVSVWGG